MKRSYKLFGQAKWYAGESFSTIKITLFDLFQSSDFSIFTFFEFKFGKFILGLYLQREFV